MQVTVLDRENNTLLKRLFELLKTDRQKAITLYRNAPYQFAENVILRIKTKDSETVKLLINQYKISKNGKLYKTVKQSYAIIVKGKSCYIVDETKKIKHLTLARALSYRAFTNSEVLSFLLEKFPWFVNIMDFKGNDVSALVSISFHWCEKNKCFNFIDIIKKKYKLNRNNLSVLRIVNPVEFKIYKDHIVYDNINLDLFTEEKEPRSKNVNITTENDLIFMNTENKNLYDFDYDIFRIPKNLQTSYRKSQIVRDAIDLAYKLNTKVNLSWSYKRMKNEHDAMSAILTNLVLEMENRQLSVNSIFKKFQEYSGFNLLDTSKDLALEGAKNKHCVATYAKKVDMGQCAIYSIGEYTCEIQRDNTNNLRINQFRGHRNVSAPEELTDKVKSIINQFNQKNKTNETSKNGVLN